MIYQTMGDRIKLALEMRNMKQKELAKRVGMTEVTISRYVTGDREPKADAMNDDEKNEENEDENDG